MKVPIFEKKFNQKFTKYSNNKNYLLDNYRHPVARLFCTNSDSWPYAYHYRAHDHDTQREVIRRFERRMSREKEAHETTPGALLTPFNIGHRRALAVSPTGNLATPCRLAKVIGCSRLATYRERFRETSDARIPKKG